MKFLVAPAEVGARVPAHPVEGPMPAEGQAHWIADQYTLRLLLEGVIVRVIEDVESLVEPERQVTTMATASDAITDDIRTKLHAEGLSDDDISRLSPEEARDLAEHPTSAPVAPGIAQEH